MSLVARELALAPRPLALASKLMDQPGFSFLWSSGGGSSYLGVLPMEVCRGQLDPEPTLPWPDRERPNELARVPRWIGIIPYEARRTLERAQRATSPDVRPAPHVSEALWWRFGAVVRVDERVTVIGDDENAVAELSRLLRRAARGTAEASLEVVREEPLSRHEERVRAALDLIARGEIYQVNLARRLDLAVRGHPLDVLQRLCASTRPAYAAALRHGELDLVSTSPELLLEQRGARIMTSPIKGTRPRGRDARSDAELAWELSADEKERAELSMIIDVERNDVGRVSRIGSVRVQPPLVATQGLVWHRRANVIGRLRPGVPRQTLLEAMLPSGSVTGAPKVRAMELIAQLEAERRGLYTGGIGYLTHSGELTLGMAIRTLSAVRGAGHYFTGGGIVADSDPAREVEETRWKARQLFARTG